MHSHQAFRSCGVINAPADPNAGSPAIARDPGYLYPGDVGYPTGGPAAALGLPVAKPAQDFGNPNYAEQPENFALEKVAAVFKATGDESVIPSGQGGAVNNIMEGYNPYDVQVAALQKAAPLYTPQQLLAALG
jgi:hypothetical protein